MKKTITVIDTFGFLFRSYFALPPLRSKEGFPTGLLTGFINFIANIGKDFQTDYIVFALDAKGNTFPIFDIKFIKPVNNPVGKPSFDFSGGSAK